MTPYAALERSTARGRLLVALNRRQTFLHRAINSNQLLPFHVDEAKLMLEIVEDGLSVVHSLDPLDNNNTIDISVVKKLLKNNPVKDLRDRWNLKIYRARLSPLEKRLFKKLVNATQANRADANHCRILLRCLESDMSQEFIIHDTLTIADHHMEKIFGPEQSKVFRNYQLKFRRRCPGAERIAVFEIGEKGRRHFHYLWYCPEIPDNWQSDPNAGLRFATQESEIKNTDDLWPWGRNMTLAMRYGAHDAWSRRLRWRWPDEKKGNKYVPSTKYGLMKIASYIAKYLKKSYTSKEKGKWRNRMTPNFGKRSLLSAMATLPTQKLMVLASNPDILKLNPLTIQGYPISPALLQTATDTLLIRHLRIHYETTDLFRWFKDEQPLPGIKERFKQTMNALPTEKSAAAQILKTTRHSLSIGNSETLKLSTTDISKPMLRELLNDLQTALDELGFYERLGYIPR